MSCLECTHRRIQAHSDQWRRAEFEKDLVRTLWAISLALTVAAGAFLAP